MDNNNQNSIPYDLLVKHLSGQTSPDENKSIDEWLHKNPENQKTFQELKDTWKSLEQVKDIMDIDLEEEWIRQKRTIEFKKQPENDKNKYFITWKISKIAAVFLVLIAAVSVAYFVFPFFLNNKIVTNGTVQSIELPDGTNVTLNANTSFIYPKKFKDNVRKVTLKGEAFFDVKPDPEKPFIISAKEAAVEVMGTSFNVNAYDRNEDITVVVSTGTVALYITSNPSEKLILQEGIMGILNIEDQSLIKRANTDRNFLAWKTKQIIFENETLNKVVQKLEDVYRTRIIVNNPALNNCRITASFDQQSIQSVIKVIEETLDIEFKEGDNTYLIDGKGCD